MPPKHSEKKAAKKPAKRQGGAKSSSAKAAGKPGGRQATPHPKRKRVGVKFPARFGSFALGVAKGAAIFGLVILSLWLARDWLTGTGGNQKNKTVVSDNASTAASSPAAIPEAASPPAVTPASNSQAVYSPDAAPPGKTHQKTNPSGAFSSLAGSLSVPSPVDSPMAANTPGNPVAPESFFSGQGAKAEIDKESSLPFKEHVQSLSEWARRIDYALGQTSLRLGMGKEELAVTGFEKRGAGKSEYTFQRLHLTLPTDSASFALTLSENLQIFAPGASLLQAGPGHWRILIGGVATHDIVIDYKDAINEFEEEGDTPPTVRATLDELMSQAPRNLKGRLAIVVDDLGANLEAMRVLAGLDYPVSVAIWPYGGKARESAELAYAHHLTILVHMPMEPIRYPKVKPGPNALYTKMTPQQVRDTLRENLNKVPHAVGMNNHMGSRFTQWRQGAEEAVRAAAERSFFVLDSVTHPDSVLFAEAVRLGTPAYKRHVFLDNKGDLNSILGQLRLAERVALHQGEAIAIGHPLPATLEALRLWQKRRDSRVELVLIQRLTPNRW